MIALVAAVTRNGVIGRDGGMPWHLPADLAHFRRVTRGHVVVMGRKTHESIGRPLKGRINLVLTRNREYQAPGCEVIHSLDEAVADERQLYVIGGAELYRAFLPYADRLFLTRIDAELPGDTYFPAFIRARWRLISSVAHSRDEKNAYDLTFEVYERTEGQA